MDCLIPVDGGLRGRSLWRKSHWSTAATPPEGLQPSPESAALPSQAPLRTAHIHTLTRRSTWTRMHTLLQQHTQEHTETETRVHKHAKTTVHASTAPTAHAKHTEVHRITWRLTCLRACTHTAPITRIHPQTHMHAHAFFFNRVPPGTDLLARWGKAIASTKNTKAAMQLRTGENSLESA